MKENLSLNIFKYLQEKNMTISFCESASGGSLSSIFSEISGVSQVFKGAIVAYSNEIKNKVVKIDDEIIKKYGAVSEEVARLMSENTNKIFKTDICVSITGNAGTNVMEDKPACMYYVGITLIDKTYVYKIQLPVLERNYNKFNIAWHALDKLYELLSI